MPIVFLHIPKTGGTSLHHLLRAHFAKPLICPERFNGLDRYSPATLQRYELFSGHFDMEQLARLPGRLSLVTLLREPKQRLLSLYYFWRAHRSEFIERRQLDRPRAAKSLLLLDFLRTREASVASHIDNVMVRTLVGPNVVGPYGRLALPPREAIDRAGRVLADFTAVGFTEALARSAAFVFNRLDLPIPREVPHLFSAREAQSGAVSFLEPCERQEITPAIAVELERLTQWDSVLYQLVLDRLWPCVEEERRYDFTARNTSLNASFTYGWTKTEADGMGLAHAMGRIDLRLARPVPARLHLVFAASAVSGGRRPRLSVALSAQAPIDIEMNETTAQTIVDLPIGLKDYGALGNLTLTVHRLDAHEGGEARRDREIFIVLKGLWVSRSAG